MQCLNYDKRITVATTTGTHSGIMTFFLDDNGQCSVSPDITSPNRKYYDVDTGKTWDSYNSLEKDLDQWHKDKPRDGEGRVVPFP